MAASAADVTESEPSSGGSPELAVIQSKLAEMRATIDRYFRAFETGTMPEKTCAPRIDALGEQAKALETRARELAARQDDEPLQRATRDDLDDLRRALRAAIESSTQDRVKPVLQALVDSIRVESRDNIKPIFRIPAVRVDSGYMGETWRRANHALMAAVAIGVG